MATIEEMAELPLNLHEYEALARDLLSPMTLGYVSGGSCDEVTLRANRAAFDRWRLLPRVMRGLRETSTATTVLGQEVALPVLIGPSGLHRLAHDEGELATIRGAHGAGTIYTMSTASTVPMDIISRDMANLQTPKHMLIPATDGGSGLATYIGAVWEPALTWDDLDWLASLSPLPVIPKGILHPEDAARAVDYGARAVIVSNHGGRQLDSAVASLDALPAVVEAVAGRGEVLLDGGVRRGTDVLKALALGARAVLIGRPVYWGLARGGASGVQHILELLRAELTLDLMLCGLASPAEVTRELLVPADTLVPVGQASAATEQTRQ
ncbi:MAG: FMN-dependent alpha-hydroxy acid dehydrogenase [Thermomicrobiales bacterium]|nr:FMN-dependent alpha-hydroxy acid dehydrogenase [Thermomicrobiales bacterium]